jgi:8-oxo-dGTP pyrophosphatase MutT (NUDIX family)
MTTGEEARPRLWSERGWSPARAAPLWAERPLRCPTGDALPVSVVLGPAQLCTLQVRPIRAPSAWGAAAPPGAPGEWDGPVLALRALRPPAARGGPVVLDWAPSGWLRASQAHRRCPGPRGGRLAPLGAAWRVDDLGVIVLAVDPGGRLLVARRASGLRLRGAAWTATASGAVDPSVDATGGVSGLEVGLRAGLRELYEEAGLRGPALRRIEPLGLVREWRRAGKPELVLRARVGPQPGCRHRPSDEVSLMRAIPDEALRRDPGIGGQADLPLRVALALHWTHPEVAGWAPESHGTGAGGRASLRAPASPSR